MSCACPAPLESADPRTAGECAKCGRPITGISTDETFAEFFDRLEAGIFPPQANAEQRSFFHGFRALCEAREREGRRKFGLDYLTHDAIANVAEELSDAAVYLYLRHLRTLRESGEDSNLDALLQACKLAVDALQMAATYPAKRRGSP